MSRPEFNQIGFDFDDPMKLIKFVEQHQSDFITKPTPVGGSYKIYTTEHNAQLITQYDPNDQLIGCLPHLRGEGQLKAKIMGVKQDANHPLDGLVLAEFEETNVPFAVDCPLFRLYTEDLQADKMINLQVCAFQMQAEIFKNKKKFQQSQLGKLDATGAFVPSGLFNPNGNPVDTPRPMAIIAGTVLDASLRKNKITKKSFWVCEVQTYGGTITTAFDAASVKKKPTKESIVAGSFQLSALPRDQDSQL